MKTVEVAALRSQIDVPAVGVEENCRTRKTEELYNFAAERAVCPPGASHHDLIVPSFVNYYPDPWF